MRHRTRPSLWVRNTSTGYSRSRGTGTGRRPSGGTDRPHRFGVRRPCCDMHEEGITMDTAHKLTITLDTLSCQREEQLLGSNPYLWPAMVFVNKSTGSVGLVSIPESSAHKILKSAMRAGDTVAIDANAGTMQPVFPGTDRRDRHHSHRCPVRGQRNTQRCRTGRFPGVQIDARVQHPGAHSRSQLGRSCPG